MISFINNRFYLQTEKTSYWFKINKYKHLEHIYFGKKVPIQDTKAFEVKRSAEVGSSVLYSQEDNTYCLDQVPLEYSGIGMGDYRFSPVEIKMPDKSFATDFIYVDHKIKMGDKKINSLPSSYGEKKDCMTLSIKLKDVSNNVDFYLIYTVFKNTNVITRRVVLKNRNIKSLEIKKIMSMSIDIPNRNYNLNTFNGGWIKETHRDIKKVSLGQMINSSTTGGSSNRHNPGIILSEDICTQQNGWAYGFNLVYSGNHFSCVELSNHDLVRVSMGINPHCFNYKINKDEIFETPEVIMTFSDKGLNGVSQNFHDFINNHVTPKFFKFKKRPVVYNHWEATFMKFNEKKLLSLAEVAKNIGIETFVIDDGWFSIRDNDTKGLGDYNVNPKKFPKGLKHFADKVNNMGMELGLWFEPEMVNKNSLLYKKHPEYVIKTPNKYITQGRNQYVLDLCKKEVQDYIINNMIKILDSTNITYVKWDMNRHISDAFSDTLEEMGNFYHEYILGLYNILEKVFRPRPHILLETCSSGGNRFDLGMLCYSSQIWSSDNTDPIERLEIQEGLSYLYPLSTISCHVSNAPHQQTLRLTPLSTRFNVASFGVLGYELDLSLLNSQEIKEIKEQIIFYKKNRNLFQYGKFFRGDKTKEHIYNWHVIKNNECVVGFFQNGVSASMGFDYLKIHGLDKDKIYEMKSKKQRLMIDRFGELIKHVAPISLNPNGLILNTINQYFSLTDAVEYYTGSGGVFESGIFLNTQFMGTYYNNQTRILGDFGSTLYKIREMSETNEC